MPPVFQESSFKFAEGEQVPEHIEGYPGDHHKDPTKYHLEGLDAFDNTRYALASNIDDLPTAHVLYTARRHHLEETQPSSISGGQSICGIQDRIHIIPPDSKTE